MAFMIRTQHGYWHPDGEGQYGRVENRLYAAVLCDKHLVKAKEKLEGMGAKVSMEYAAPTSKCGICKQEKVSPPQA